MRARDIKGKVVERVRQVRCYERGEITYDVQAIYFTDGTYLILNAIETEYEPIVEARLVKPG